MFKKLDSICLEELTSHRRILQNINATPTVILAQTKETKSKNLPAAVQPLPLAFASLIDHILHTDGTKRSFKIFWRTKI